MYARCVENSKLNERSGSRFKSRAGFMFDKTSGKYVMHNKHEDDYVLLRQQAGKARREARG